MKSEYTDFECYMGISEEKYMYESLLEYLLQIQQEKNDERRII